MDIYKDFEKWVKAQAVLIEKFNKALRLLFRMQLNIDMQDGKFPYKADYIGYETPPMIPRLGVGSSNGRSMSSYSGLLEGILKDLTGCPDVIEVKCSNKLSEEQQAVVTTLISLLNDYNTAQLRLSGVSKSISKKLN